MATFDDLPAAPIPQRTARPRPAWRAARIVLAHPAAVFVLLSMLFGMLTIAFTPPLEGPDEPAHFLRAYGFSRGEIIPATADAQSRKGILLPTRLHRGYAVFEAALFKLGKAEGFSYRQVWAEYFRKAAEPADETRVFVLYWGSEGYSPVPYLPQIAAALLARAADLDFAGTLFLMRFAGLVAMTAVTAYAIAIAGPLRWAFLLIAMLPSALYGRSVVSADGAALAYAMAVTALCLGTARAAGAGRSGERAAFMTLCILSKPPQIALALLEAMARPFKELPRRWRTLALVVLPGLILSPLWIAAVSGDAGAWRIFLNTDMPPEQFFLGWKLRFMLEHPSHFPVAAVTTLRWTRDYWLQLIGILGWVDTWLQYWVYPAVSLALIGACFAPLQLERSIRLRIAVVSGVTAFAYWLAIYLIFFVIWTPIAAIEVQGVQGRYFLPVLPAVALAFAALVNRGPSPTATGAIALAGAVLSGVAVVEAILRVVGLPFGL